MRHVARSLIVALAFVAGSGVSTTVATTTPTLAQMIGQKLVVRMSGTTPTPICSVGSAGARSAA